MQRSLRFSSKNRDKAGISKAHDFTINFNPVLELSNDMKHEMAINRIAVTYSWHNITLEYTNNTIKYSTNGGTSWETITFVCIFIPTLMTIFMNT